MYQGMTLERLASAVEHQSELKEDYVVDTRELTMLNGTELYLPDGKGEFHVQEIAHDQIGTRLGIPSKYYDYLRNGGGDKKLTASAREELRQLLDRNVNTLFRAAPERRMIRTFGEDGGTPPQARAFLSERYRTRDNDQLLAELLPILAGIDDVSIESADLTDTRFYVKALAPRVQGEVKKGDIVQAGVMIRNSEVGHGALVVQPMMFRLVCTNGMVVAEATKSRHVGGRLEGDEDYKVYRDETLRKADEAFFAKMGDTVRACVDETRFNDILVNLREAGSGETIESPPAAMEALTKRFSLSEGESGLILRHLTEGGDLSAYGALNAITRASQDVESYERATELETVGGEVLAMAGTREWHDVAVAS